MKLEHLLRYKDEVRPPNHFHVNICDSKAISNEISSKFEHSTKFMKIY